MRHIDYTVDNRAWSISNGNRYMSGTLFKYGSDGQRYQKFRITTAMRGRVHGEITHYVGNLEIEGVGSDTPVTRRYVAGVGLQRITDTAEETTLLVSDHLVSSDTQIYALRRHLPLRTPGSGDGGHRPGRCGWRHDERLHDARRGGRCYQRAAGRDVRARLCRGRHGYAGGQRDSRHAAWVAVRVEEESKAVRCISFLAFFFINALFCNSHALENGQGPDRPVPFEIVAKTTDAVAIVTIEGGRAIEGGGAVYTGQSAGGATCLYGSPAARIGRKYLVFFSGDQRDRSLDPDCGENVEVLNSGTSLLRMLEVRERNGEEFVVLDHPRILFFDVMDINQVEVFSMEGGLVYRLPAETSLDGVLSMINEHRKSIGRSRLDLDRWDATE